MWVNNKKLEYMLYYGDKAYNSLAIPLQPKPSKRIRRGLAFKFKTLLPWGNTEDVAPIKYANFASLKYVREDTLSKAVMEQRVKDKIYSLDASGNALDHQMIRYTPNRFFATFLAYAYPVSKILTFVWGIACLCVDLLIFYSKQSFEGFVFFYSWLPLPIIWLFCYLVIRFIPERLWNPINKKGMLWELNRRTGMVTVRKNRFRAPFYEWDAYVDYYKGSSTIIYYRLYLIHRYQNYTISFTSFAESNSLQEVYAEWDFIQNYMDISQPLPDIPLLEQWRPYDPITLKHDKQTRRYAKFWFNMRDQKLRSHFYLMNSKIRQLKTQERTNLMEKHFVERAL